MSMTRTEPDPRRRRRLRRLAIVGPPAVFIVAAGIGGVTHVVRDRGKPPECVTPAQVPTGAVAPATRAPGGGGLRIVEKGFTQLTTDAHMVSLGAVLENTSGQVAYRSRIALRVVDEQDRPATPTADDRFLRMEIPVIFPGERVVAGAAPHVNPAESGELSRVAGFDVDLGRTHWVAPDDARRSLAPISMDGQQTKRFADDSASVTYTFRSRYCEIVPLRGVAMVFRNHAGAVVGGSFEPLVSNGWCSPGTGGLASEGYATADRSVPEDVDLAKTEVSPYCDITRPAPTPSELDGPIS
jgi:hypothetical protein